MSDNSWQLNNLNPGQRKGFEQDEAFMKALKRGEAGIDTLDGKLVDFWVRRKKWWEID